MATKFAAEKKVGFIMAETLDSDSKEAKAIARLWNDDDGKTENKNWNIIDSSGKGFYDSSAEFIVLNKQTNELLLCTAHTNFGGHNWKSPDYIYIRGRKKRVIN